MCAVRANCRKCGYPREWCTCGETGNRSPALGILGRVAVVALFFGGLISVPMPFFFFMSLSRDKSGDSKDSYRADPHPDAKGIPLCRDFDVPPKLGEPDEPIDLPPVRGIMKWSLEYVVTPGNYTGITIPCGHVNSVDGTWGGLFGEVVIDGKAFPIRDFHDLAARTVPRGVHWGGTFEESKFHSAGCAVLADFEIPPDAIHRSLEMRAKVKVAFPAKAKGRANQFVNDERDLVKDYRLLVVSEEEMAALVKWREAQFEARIMWNRWQFGLGLAAMLIAALIDASVYKMHRWAWERFDRLCKARYG